jgi:hypothetical protein
MRAVPPMWIDCLGRVRVFEENELGLKSNKECCIVRFGGAVCPSQSTFNGCQRERTRRCDSVLIVDTWVHPCQGRGLEQGPYPGTSP